MIRRFYYWPSIRGDINAYISSYIIYQRIKTPRHRPYGLLVPLPIPIGPWQDISLDFIVGLLLLLYIGVAYDSILVIVDRVFKDSIIYSYYKHY